MTIEEYESQKENIRNELHRQNTELQELKNEVKLKLEETCKEVPILKTELIKLAKEKKLEYFFGFESEQEQTPIEEYFQINTQTGVV